MLLVRPQNSAMEADSSPKNEKKNDKVGNKKMKVWSHSCNWVCLVWNALVVSLAHCRLAPLAHSSRPVLSLILSVSRLLSSSTRPPEEGLLRQEESCSSTLAASACFFPKLTTNFNHSESQKMSFQDYKLEYFCQKHTLYFYNVFFYHHGGIMCLLVKLFYFIFIVS